MKIPVGIPVFVAAAGIDPRYAKLVHRYLLSAAFWLLFGTGVALLVSFKLNYPDLFLSQWLSFGRIRPIHTGAVLYGWASLALLGIALYVVPRSSKTNLHSLKAARVALWLWNIGLVAGVLTVDAGMQNGSQEYREFPAWVIAFFALAIVLHAWNFYKTIANRTVSQIYISNWFILGGTTFTVVIVAVGYLPIFGRGIAQTTIQGYFMHNVIGMWFTPLAVGATYYTLPKLLNKPIYSYALGVLGFWTHTIFYTLIGTHHYIYTAVPTWLQTAAIIFSVGMMVPVWASTGNFLLTMRGERNARRVSYSLPFVLVGVVAYGIGSAQGTAEAFRSANLAWHFTSFTVGHSHLAAVGFVSFLACGSIYGLLPRMTGKEPSVELVGLHFWLSVAGLSAMVVSLSIAGSQQGAAWNEGRPFLDSIRQVAPLWVWRSVAGTFMALGHIVFAWNLWSMRPGAFVNLMQPPEPEKS